MQNAGKVSTSQVRFGVHPASVDAMIKWDDYSKAMEGTDLSSVDLGSDV